MKYNPWHDPDNGQFTFANTGVYHGPGGGGGGIRGKAKSPEKTRATKAKPSEPDDIVITAKRQTVEDANALSNEEFGAFERAAETGQWTPRRENAEIHEYVRLKKAVAARRAWEKAGERDWAQQGKGFARLYAEEALAQAAGAAVGRFVVAPAVRRAAPVVERLVRPQAYARKIAERAPRPPAPEPVWVDENVAMKPRARRYNDGATGARSNPATRKSQAPGLYRTTEDGKRRLVRFDGYEDGAYPVYIDRKTGVSLKSGARDQAIRQSIALRENNAAGRWEVPDDVNKRRALKLFNELGIENIGVKVVKE